VANDRLDLGSPGQARYIFCRVTDNNVSTEGRFAKRKKGGFASDLKRADPPVFSVATSKRLAGRGLGRVSHNPPHSKKEGVTPY